MKDHDLIIVGAGFAGLACAETAARNNLNTLVLERKPEAGCQLHTTGIVVKEIAKDWNIPQKLVRRINGVRLYGPSLDYMDLYAPDYYFLATNTAGLLRWQAAQAIRAGARIIYEHPYRGSHQLDQHHVFVEEQLRCRYLTGCDGARSRVARHYGLGQNKQFLIGVEAEYAAVPNIDEEKLHVFIDTDLAKGYIGWVVPGVNCIQIGLATRFPHAPQLQKFIHKIAPLFSLNQLKPFSHRAGVIPCGGRVKNFYGDKTLLLGDAAGMVSPVTAGGIHPAVQIGQQAGTAIANHLIYSGPNPGMVISHTVPDYTFKKLLREIFDHMPMPNAACDLLLQTPILRSLAQTLFFHKRGLFTIEAWRDIFRILTH